MKWLRFFWRYVTYRKALGLALLGCALAVAAAELTIPWLLRLAIDTALGEIDDLSLNVLGLWMLGVIVFLYMAHTALLHVEARMLYEASYDLRRRLYTHIHHQAMPFFQRHKTGELMHRVTSDATLFEDNAVELFSDLPFEVLTVGGVLTVMALTDVRLMGLVIVFLAAASALTAYLGRPLPTLRKSIQNIGARLSGRLQETLTGIRTVQAFKNDAHELARLDEANRSICQAEVKQGKIEAYIMPLFELMELLGVVLVVWYGSHLILSKQITAGALVAFISYMEILAGPVSRIGNFYRYFQTCRAVGERLQNLLDDCETLPSSSSPQTHGDGLDMAVEGVSFQYPGSPRQVLRDVSFTVQQGETIAVVGRNGAGKSTLLDLLLRFYDPTTGQITIGGVDLKDWDLAAWRETVGTMSQDVFLFQATIAENITYGRLEASREELAQAARESGVEQLLQRFPQGFETIVGERGTKLSGGERQLIALARLFLRKPHILLLDEPTSHLDGEALQQVGTALQRLMTGRTTFLIAHRPETVQLADRILLFDQGRLLAEGTHASLLETNALYRKLLAEMGYAHKQKEERENARARTARPSRVV
jgi:ABC-type multidrug transport system fused ATPase/permease subunit